MLILCVSLPAFMLSCGSSKEKTREDSGETSSDLLEQYEQSFDPSKYPTPLPSIDRHPGDVSGDARGKSDVRNESETAAGFRAQVLLTQDIELANQIRDSLNLMYPDEWIYIVYEAPSYKVRVGNFNDRPSANRMVRDLIEKGFKDTWVVPDVIIKNAPPKPPPVQLSVPSDSTQTEEDLE